MTYDELNALYQQGQTGETFYDEQGNPYTFNDVRLPDGGVLSRRGDGSYRVETHNDGRGRGGGYDIYADGRQEPFGFDKTQSTGERLLSVFGPVAAVASAGALAPYLTGAGAAGAAGGTGIGTAGAGGASLSELLAAQGLPALAGVEPIAATAASFGAPSASALGAGATAAGSALSNGSWDVLPPASDPGAANGSWDVLPPAAPNPQPPPPGTTPPGTTQPETTPPGTKPPGTTPPTKPPSDYFSTLLSENPWLAPLLGAGAAVAGNGDITSGRTGSASETRGLDSWLKPFAEDYVSRAKAIQDQPLNSAITQGTGQLYSLSMLGDTTVNAGRAQQENVIGGGMLNSNPYIDGVAQNIGNRMGDAYARGTAANTDATFARAKAFGGSAWDEQQRANSQAFGDSLGQTMSNLYYGNYQGERAAQDAAARGSLGFGQDSRANATGLADAGWKGQAWPLAALGAYGSAVNPAYGSTSSATTTDTSKITAPNDWMAGLGGAAAGAGIFRSIFGGK